MDPKIFNQSISYIDQLTYIMFAFQMGKSGKDIERELKQVLGRAALPYTTITRWMRAFQDGRTDVEEARGGAHNVHPEADERIELVKEKLRDNRGWSLTELSLETNIPLLNGKGHSRGETRLPEDPGTLDSPRTH